jgi:pyroglutamyl-peptidase
LDSKKQPIILLTGSEPFDGRTINTSWEAVRQLNGLVIDGALVQSEELPVLWHGSAEMLIEFIQTYEPVLVVNTGEGGPVLSLEKYAHNRTDSTLDNAGELPDSSSIISNAPARFEAPLDLVEISNVLTQEGVQNVVSSDAGGYLCNFRSFHTYAYINNTQSHVPALFVHVPPTSSSGHEANISMIAKALTIILQQSMHQVAQHRTKHGQW